MRLPFSGKDFAWIYERCNQIAFLDGHVRAFQYFGGVAARGVYDNLAAAVKRRLGLEAQLTDRFRALASHYLFEPCFTRRGEGHDKGSVEARGKGVRLQHLSPIPRGDSLAAISTELLARLETAACEPEGSLWPKGRGALRAGARMPAPASSSAVRSEAGPARGGQPPSFGPRRRG